MPRHPKLAYKTKAGNPKALTTTFQKVIDWVHDGCKATTDDVVANSVNSAGFASNFQDWDSAKHGTYNEELQWKTLSTISSMT